MLTPVPSRTREVSRATAESATSGSTKWVSGVTPILPSALYGYLDV